MDELHTTYKGRPVAQDFNTALNAWLVRAGAIANDYILEIDPKGRKYVRITMKLRGNENGQVSVFCFIDKATGNVLKPATWATPAKHARGNVYITGKEGVGRLGANYLR